MIASLFNCKVGSFHVTYLGIPFRLGCLLKEDWQCMINKIEKRIDSWRDASLSRVGRLVLTNFVLSALPSYLISFFYLPDWLPRGLTNLEEFFSGLDLPLLGVLSV